MREAQLAQLKGTWHPIDRDRRVNVPTFIELADFMDYTKGTCAVFSRQLLLTVFCERGQCCGYIEPNNQDEVKHSQSISAVLQVQTFKRCQICQCLPPLLIHNK